ncbi:RING finger and WD repeat domain-containing protein 3 [Rhizopus stolonifer]|uniref:RING-type E3 ubiquitin transferase n=1 Tax=Rhizopus stolonifer TaxID=4846 RepID=A0A367KV72_RHIST|nr:RING finger and WD repeat domain-containing protein 3 [Rhizopus stolonifer]
MDPIRSPSDSSEDEHDFQKPIMIPFDNLNSRKRHHAEVDTSNDLEEEEADHEVDICTLCQTSWTNGGFHRIVNLKCGHVFGKSCISTHIRDMLSKFGAACCPICKKPAVKSEPRHIWPTKLIPENQEDLKSLKSQIEEASKTLKDLVQKNAILKGEIEKCKLELNSLVPENGIQHTTRPLAPPPSIPQQQDKLIYKYKVKFPNEHYQVVDLNPFMDMVVLATHKTRSNTYGLRKINVYDPSLTEFVSINHRDRIRDIKHSPQAMILSTGDDKTLKLTSMTKNLVLQSYRLSTPCYSCAFDSKTSHTLYCGSVTGDLMVFDIRNTKSSLHVLKKPMGGTVTPIISIHSTLDAVVCADEQSIYSWQLGSDGQYAYCPLEHNPQLFSASFYGNTVCTAAKDNNSKIYMSHLNASPALINVLDWSCEMMFDSFKCSHFEKGSTIYICSTKDNWVHLRDKEQDIQTVQCDAPIIDIKHTSIQQDQFTAILSEKELQMYKFI